MVQTRPSASASIMVSNPAAHLLSGGKSKSGAHNENVATELPNSTEKVPFNHNGQMSQNHPQFEGEPAGNRMSQHYNGDACLIYLP